MSVVKADSEGWTVFLGRRTDILFLGASSPDCNQNRTGLVTAGGQRMRAVAGSEGAADVSTSDCPHRTVLFFSFLFSLISLIADGPHHYHPACGYKGSSHLSPVHALQFFIAMQVQQSNNSSTNG